jgi:hypothetical protein
LAFEDCEFQFCSFFNNTKRKIANPNNHWVFFFYLKLRWCEDANLADINREVCLHSKYSYVWAGRGEKGDNGDWARGLKMGQLILSMGPAGAEVRSYIQRAPFQVRGLFLILNILKTPYM